MTHGSHKARQSRGRGRRLLSVLLTFIASMVISAQSPVNARMNDLTHNAIYTGVWCFLGGLLTNLVVMVLRPRSIREFLRIGSRMGVGGIRMWHLWGGFAGASFVAVQSGLVSATGVALFTVAAVAGQTFGALIVDGAGLGPSGKHHVTLVRVLAALVAVGGVVIAISGDGFSNVNVLGITITVLVGAFVAVQPAMNGHVALHTGEPLAASLVNFIVGLIVLLVAFAGQQMQTLAEFSAPPSPLENPVVWLGGPFSVFFVVVAAKTARELGVFVFTLTSVLGQLVASVLLDYLFPTDATHLTVQLGVGLAVTAVAVAMANRTTPVTSAAS